MTLYAKWTANTYTVTYNELGLQNMNSWGKAYGERFTINYDESTRMNTISCAGSSGWEVLYQPIATTSGKTYTLSFNYQNPNGYTALSGYDGIGCQILNKIENSNNSANQLAITHLSPTAGGLTTVTLQFTATSNRTYVAYNFGMAADGVTSTIKLGEFRVIADSVSTQYGTEYTIPSRTTMTGCEYKGWYTEPNEEGTKIESTTKVSTASDHTIHVVWNVQSFKQIVQVRYENADGTWGDYSNEVDADYDEGSIVSWSRAADTTYQAASITSYTVTEAKTTQVSVYRNTFTVTCQYRFQKADGTYENYQNGNSGTYRYGQTHNGWSRAKDTTYQAASIASFTVTKAETKQVNVNRNTFTIVKKYRLQNADGSWGGYTNIVNGTYRYGQTIAKWSYTQTAVYNANSGYAAFTVTGNVNNSYDVSRRTYSVLTRYRLQNTSGGYGGYTNIVNGTYRYGQTIGAWSRAANAEYNAASYAAFTVTGATTKNIDVTRKTYTVTFKLVYYYSDVGICFSLDSNSKKGTTTSTFYYGATITSPKIYCGESRNPNTFKGPYPKTYRTSLNCGTCTGAVTKYWHQDAWQNT